MSQDRVVELFSQFREVLTSADLTQRSLPTDWTWRHAVKVPSNTVESSSTQPYDSFGNGDSQAITTYEGVAELCQNILRLSPIQILLFLIQSDCLDLIKTAFFTHEHIPLRYTFVTHLHPILTLIYVYLHEYDLEVIGSYWIADSQSDIQRKREEYIDQLHTLFMLFVDKVMGNKAQVLNLGDTSTNNEDNVENDNLIVTNIYAGLLLDLFAMYHDGYGHLHHYLDTIAGRSGSTSKHYLQKTQQQCRYRSIQLGIVIQKILDKVLIDPFLLQQRLSSSLSTNMRLMNAIWITVLKQWTTQYKPNEALPALASPAMCQLGLPKKDTNAFLAIDASSSSAYREYNKGELPLNVQIFVIDWIVKVVLPTCTHPTESFEVFEELNLLKDLLIFLQYPLLAQYRVQVYEHVWNRLMAYLMYWVDISTELTAENYDMVDMEMYEEVLGMALFVFRYLALNAELKNDALFSRNLKILQCIAYLTTSATTGGSASTALPTSPRQVLTVRYLTDFFTTLLDLELLSTGAVSSLKSYSNLQGLATITLNLPFDNSSSSANNAVVYSGSVFKTLLQDAIEKSVLSIHRPDFFTATFISVLSSTLQHAILTLSEHGLHSDSKQVPAYVFQHFSTTATMVNEVNLLGEEALEGNADDWQLALRDYLFAYLISQQAVQKEEAAQAIGDTSNVGKRIGWDIEHKHLHISSVLLVLTSFPTPSILSDFLHSHPFPNQELAIAQCETFLLHQYEMVLNAFLNITELALFLSHTFAPLVKWAIYHEASQSVLLLWESLAAVFLEASPSLSAISQLLTTQYATTDPWQSIQKEWRIRQCDIHAVIAYSFENTAKVVTSELMLSQHIPVFFAFVVEVVMPYMHRHRNDIEDCETILNKYIQVVLSFARAVLFRQVEKKSFMEELQSRASLGLLGGFNTRDLQPIVLQHDLREDVEKQQLCIGLLSNLYRLLSNDALGKPALEAFYHFILEIERALLYTEIKHYLGSSAALFALQQQQQYMNSSNTDDMLIDAVQLLTSVLPLREEYFALVRAGYALVKGYNEKTAFNAITLVPITLPILIDTYLQQEYHISVSAIRSWQRMPIVSAELDVILNHLQRLAPHAIGTKAAATLAGDMLHEEIDLLSLSHPVMSNDVDLLDVAASSTTNDNSAIAKANTNTSSSSGCNAYSKHAGRLWQVMDKDHTRMQGLFSSSFAMDTTHGSLLHLIDTDALVQDVFLPRIRLEPSATHTDSVGEDEQKANDLIKLQSNVLLEYNEVAWTQLSAPNDVLVVLACVVNTTAPASAFSPAKLTIRLRVINRTTFKIPFFNVYLLSKASHDSIEKAAEAYYVTKFRRNINTLPMAYDQLFFASRATCVNSASPILQAEYFPPNAMLEREVDLDVFSFTGVEVVLRVEYPDLSKDNQSYLVPGGSTVQTTTTSMVIGKKTNPSYLTHLSDMHSNTTFNALIDCDALYVPITSLLIPYGYGAFDANRCWQSSSHTQAGIPWVVFLAQYQRLSGQYSHSVTVLTTLQTTLSAMHALVECVKDNLQSHGGIGMHYLGLDCMALPIAPGQQAVGWCLQTLWGQELSIVFNAAASDDGSHNGRVTIRCESQAVLSSVLNDIPYLIHSISSGYLVALPEDF